MPFCHARLSARKPEHLDLTREPKGWGDRIRRRRLELGLLQRQAAKQIGCSVASVTSWERNRAEPKVSELPGIICFLGYAPVDSREPWSARLSRARQAVGLSRKRLAAQLDVDESTVKRWEDGRGRPLARLRERLQVILRSAPP
ncbi:MAG: helix-turn-helix domain-containing protein [Candidatus Binatia bacterium]